jgi:hypothetical protein
MRQMRFFLAIWHLMVRFIEVDPVYSVHGRAVL